MTPAAVSLRLATLKKRSDFVRLSSGKRVVTPGFIVQATPTPPGCQGIRVGFTCSKKVGNAVARNRAKRRLREVARAVLPTAGKENFDYVLIGRRETTDALPFLTLQNDLRRALEKLHALK